MANRFNMFPSVVNKSSSHYSL